MQVDLKYIYQNITRKNMVYIKESGNVRPADKLDLSLIRYDECIYLPYINEQDIYLSFLDEKGIEVEEVVIFSAMDIGTNFRYYMQKQVNGTRLMSEYFDYKKKYIFPVMMKWCESNNLTVQV